MAAALAAGLAYFRLSPLHPVTLWLAPWAIVLTLFCVRALPYRDLSGETIAIIAAGLVMVTAGVLLGSRGQARKATATLVPGRAAVEIAAITAACATMALLFAFLVQLAASFGWRAVLISDANVRLSIGAGSTAVTVKYIYFAFAGASLAGLAAGLNSGRARWRWAALAALLVGTEYFSTGRSNLLLAGIMALLAFAAGQGRSPGRLRPIVVSAAAVIPVIALFLGMGALLDKSFKTSDIATFDNVFVRHPELQPVALPYQYVTSTVAAFDRVVAVTPAGGRRGCVTLSPLCSLGARLGLPVEPEPKLTGFTRPPIPFNTFGAFYGPLVDFGRLGGAVMLLALGFVVGRLWRWVGTGSPLAAVLYAPMGAALLYSTVENSLLPPHLVGAGVLSVAMILVADRFVLPRLGRFSLSRRLRW